MMHKIITSSKRIKRKKNFHIFSYFLCISIFVFVISIKFFQIDRIIVKEVNILGNKDIPREEIFKIIESRISGRYFKIFPRNNYFLLSEKSLTDDILKNNLRIEKVEITVEDFQKLKVVITERTPRYVWCPKKNNCLYLDVNGLAYDKAPKFSDGVFLEFNGVVSDNGEDNVNKYLNKYILETDKLNKLVKFGEEANKIISRNLDNKWKISSISIQGREDFEYIFKDGVDKEWKIIISTSDISNNYLSSNAVLKGSAQIGDITFDSILISTARNLEVTLQSKPLTVSIKDDKKNLEYIDLRFGNKIFYRFYEDNKGSTLNKI